LEILVDFAFIIRAIVTDLHDELIERHRLDSRWRDARRRFLKANGLLSEKGYWPS
jgi:hypothetical protein